MNPQAVTEQLRDIHLPNPIGWWPPAPGWWLLLLLSLALIAGALIWRKLRFQRLAYKREALAEWQSIHARYLHDKDNARLLTELSILLKRTCITRYGRGETAGLAGEPWLDFLDQTGRCKDFTKGPGRALVDQRFSPRPTLDGAELLQATLNWLNKQC
ncbi:MAG TPA: DUF4381 domain-containing protein [Dongiaceae bacterium]|nr:DUF4381 domain-containing protein [Dongiaceae bacterium]